jgi:hypothetical protein
VARISVDVGQVYPATLTVTNASGAPANCAAMALVITLPDQTTVTPAVTNPPAVTGTYEYDYVITQPGLHKFAWTGTSPAVAKTDWQSAVAFRSILSLADARDYLNLTTTAHDETIRSALAAITRRIERIIGTCVPRTFTDQWVDGVFRDVIKLPHGPLLSATSVTSVTSVYAGGPSWAPGEMIVNPEAATVRLLSLLPFWYGPWKATYTAGRSVISDDVTEGARQALWDLWSVRRAVLIGNSAEGIAAGWQLPYRIEELIGGEERPGFG